VIWHKISPDEPKNVRKSAKKIKIVRYAHTTKSFFPFRIKSKFWHLNLNLEILKTEGKPLSEARAKRVAFSDEFQQRQFTCKTEYRKESWCAWKKLSR
jgi:hypothetical protein